MRGWALGLGLMGLTGCASTDDAAVPVDVEVTMNCREVADGGLADCQVIRERPEGYGMAAEALASAAQGRASVQPVGERTRVRGMGSRTTVSTRIPIDSAAVARWRQWRTETSQPRP